MKYILGLGNIGDLYKNSRHNTGFDVLDILASENDLQINRKKKNYLYTTATLFKQNVMLIKPTTLMNLSGLALQELKDEYNIDYKDIIVVYDDMDIMPGKIKLKKSGDSAGHNGIKSIIDVIGSNVFDRIKVGIGRPHDKKESIDFVLGVPKDEENEKHQIGIDRATTALALSIKMGFDWVLNRFDYNQEKENG